MRILSVLRYHVTPCFVTCSTRISMLLCVTLLGIFPEVSSAWGELRPIADVEAQPLKSQARRVVSALEFLGQPLTAAEQESINAAFEETDDAQAVLAIQSALASRVLAGVHINPESRVKVARGDAPAELIEQGWSLFLVRVHNEGGVTAQLRASSPNAKPLYKRSTGSPDPELEIQPKDVPDRWLDIDLFDKRPINPRLSGLELEYRILQLYSRDRGKREAILAFDVGQGTQDLGFRNQLPILFDCRPAVEVRLDVVDDDGQPTTGQFVFTDNNGRVYPARSRRLAPDFFFHDQVYRHDGESITLPPGEYNATYTRGPEYKIQRRSVTIPEKAKHTESFRLERWIKLTDYDWYSGDHHVHAAGCAHYEAPTEGVTPNDMMRHILGEDLNVGCVLSWGPCWYAQKEFFDGKVHELSTNNYKMRYDVEVSGFPSSHAGHLCLLGLTEDDYPGTTKIDEWPSWDLPVLKWGKEQGGVVGFSHSGWGLDFPTDDLPNFNMPPFDGIGANEYIVDVVHGACDFISAVDTPIVSELAIWYHTLNCGYTCRISGETDFPCIYGERVGLGRIYVKLDADQPLSFDRWLQGLKNGRSYCCDGLTHLIDFSANGLGVGEKGADGQHSKLAINKGDSLKIKVKACGYLGAKPRDDIRRRPLNEQPYWHLERSRLGDSRRVPVELIVNGFAVERREIEADGTIEEIEFDYVPKQSSWIAVRIFAGAHTNPIFVTVDGKPIRSSKKSAQWCLDAVDVCWKSKEPQIRDSEKEAAQSAYDVARDAYRQILTEAFDDRTGQPPY